MKDQEKICAYMKEKEALDTKEPLPPLSLWLLDLLNRVFKTTFMKGPEDYMVAYERGRKKARLLATLTRYEKIAVGLELGQFYVRYGPERTRLVDYENAGWPTGSPFKDWAPEHQEAYRNRYDNSAPERDHVLSGPIVGDYPQDQFTPKEEAELDSMRELGWNWGPGKDVPHHWTTGSLFPQKAE